MSYMMGERELGSEEGYRESNCSRERSLGKCIDL